MFWGFCVLVAYALLKEKVREALDIRFEDNGQEKKKKVNAS